ESQQGLDSVKNHPTYQKAAAFGLLSHPAVEEKLAVPQEALQLQIEIQEMWCPSCALLIRLLLLKEKGVHNCVVDYGTDLASITYDSFCIAQEKILRLIEDLGYRPVFLGDPAAGQISFSLSLRLAVAAFFSLHAMMFAYPVYASYFEADGENFPLLFGWLS